MQHVNHKFFLLVNFFFFFLAFFFFFFFWGGRFWYLSFPSLLTLLRYFLVSNFMYHSLMDCQIKSDFMILLFSVNQKNMFESINLKNLKKKKCRLHFLRWWLLRYPFSRSNDRSVSIWEPVRVRVCLKPKSTITGNIYN